MGVYRESPEWLILSIESILKQTCTDFEFIIIVDDPVNHDLISIVKHYAQKDKRVRYFVNDKNRGLVYSLNKALKYAKGKYIARMDADDISHPQRLEKQLNYLCRHNLDLIGANVRLFRDENDFFYTTNKLLTHQYLKKMLSYGAIGIVHPTFFGKNIVFKTLDGYADILYAEDMDFVARALCKGYKIGNIKDVLLDCRYRNDSITKTYAYIMDMNARWITQLFNQCLKHGAYMLDQEDKIREISVDKMEKFNKKQILLAEARTELTNGRYIKFLFKIIYAVYHSTSTLYNLKINFMLKVLKIQEDRDLKRISQ